MFIKIIFITVVALFATKKPLPETAAPTAPVNKTLLLKLVNDVRKKGCRCGDTYYPAAAPLNWNEQLEKAAMNHSADMFRRNYFSHASPEGLRAGERLDQAGYTWKSFGENIALGYRSENEVVEGWISSPGHCKNIMNRSFKEMGVGRVGNYWTQTFGFK